MIQNILGRLLAPAPERLPEPDARVALAALLVRVARADGQYDAAEIARIDGELTIKRLQRSARRLRLLPRNPAHAPIEVQRGQDFAIEGMYCGLVRLG